MENNAISLQEKIQKLIDSYQQDKKKISALEEQNATLTEENMQLIKQIDGFNQARSGSDSRIRELEDQLRALDKKYKDLEQAVSGFETIATDAISKIDSIIPDL
jgi:chromosome segregation ATPase